MSVLKTKLLPISPFVLILLLAPRATRCLNIEGTMIIGMIMEDAELAEERS